MAEYMALKIMKAKDEEGLASAQNRYRIYFVKPSGKRLYGRYQDDVDTILISEGYEDCIVTA